MQKKMGQIVLYLKIFNFRTFRTEILKIFELLIWKIDDFMNSFWFYLTFKDQRDAIFKELEGRVCELTKHKIANTLVEACYNDYCNAAQRNRFLQEFFGPEFRYDFHWCLQI